MVLRSAPPLPALPLLPAHGSAGVQSGWAPCPSNPGACTAPDGWYPELERRIGQPLGPAVKAGTTLTRKFEHCVAFVDLADRRKSKVTWVD